MVAVEVVLGVDTGSRFCHRLHSAHLSAAEPKTRPNLLANYDSFVQSVRFSYLPIPGMLIFFLQHCQHLLLRGVSFSCFARMVALFFLLQLRQF